MDSTATPNAYCVILGTPGTDPLTIVGPFQTMDEAAAHASEHQQKSPPQPAMADILIAPANCP
jgi:hypothetical protein